MSQPRLLARLGPILAAIGLRLHQVRLARGLVVCTGCGDFATSLADLCDNCDNDMRADCQARDKEDDMPQSSTTHTLYRAKLHDIGPEQVNDPIERPRLVLRVVSQRWSLRKGPGRRLCWHTVNNPVAFCYANHPGIFRGRVYPKGWHPHKAAAVGAYYDEQHEALQRANLAASEARERCQLAADWLSAKRSEAAVEARSQRRSTAEQLEDPEVRQFVDADHSRRGGTV